MEVIIDQLCEEASCSKEDIQKRLGGRAVGPGWGWCWAFLTIFYLVNLVQINLFFLNGSVIVLSLL